MATSRNPRRLGSDFTLGGEQAEADTLLERAFYQSGHYSAIVRRDDNRAFLVGRTGGGKSAVLQHLESSDPQHVIRINPEDLSLPYITELGAVQYLASLGLNLDPLFIALWKHVFLVEIIRYRYKITSPQAKVNFFDTLMQRITRDPSKRQALEYLNEFEDKFWQETDERVKDIITKFEKQVDSEAKATFGIPHVGSLAGGGANLSAYSTEIRTAQAERFQRIVNATQLARLNKMMEVLNDDILDSVQNYTYIVIDDLDRDWVDERIANDLIRCLFRAVLDLKRVRNLKILVALRTNIFEELSFGGRTGGQEEKFRALTLRMRWTKGQLQQLLDERTRAAAELHNIPNVTSLADLIPNTNNVRGNAFNYIIDRTLLRPRDAIAYLNECFVLAAGKTRLTWEIISAAERPYSYKRLLALRDEWKPTYPDIDKVFDKFRQAPILMSRDEFALRIDEAMLLVTEFSFSGTVWMTNLSEPFWNGTSDEWAELYHPISRLLFNLGFIGCSATRDGRQVTYFYDDPDFLERVSNLENTQSFSIHPAFRAALDARDNAVRRTSR